MDNNSAINLRFLAAMAANSEIGPSLDVNTRKFLTEAADEIDQLRAELKKAQDGYSQFGQPKSLFRSKANAV